MRLLSDECTSGSIVTALIEAGFDVVRAADVCRSDPDEQVLAWAFAEGRILLTEEKDFGELTIRLGQPSHGVIIVLLPNHKSAERAERVLAVLGNENNVFAGRLTVIEASRIRQRELSAT